MAIEFHKELESQDVMEGDVTFTCELTKPNQEATCTFPDETICLSKKYEVTLKINKCALSDINQVSIKCKTAKSSAQLFMKEKLAEVMPCLKDKHSKKTNDAKLTVPLTKPNIQVTWYRDGKEILPDDNFKPVSSEKDYMLVISEAQLAFPGTYECVLARGLETSAELTVKEKVRTKELESQEVMEGDVTFTCELTKPNQEVTWTFAGKTIRPSKKYEISSEGCTYTLKINKCALSDINQVSIKCKTTKSSAQLSVKEMAIEFHKELESQDVMEGDVTFTCELTKPNQEATCTFPDETICLSKKYEVTLKINKCALSDINQVSIKCKTAKSSAQLFMKEKLAEVMPCLKDKHSKKTNDAKLTVPLTKPNIQVTWYRDGKEILPDDNFKPVSSEKDYMLVISEAQLAFPGTYECVLARGLETSAELTVKEKVRTKELESQEVMEGDVTFTCELTKPNQEVTWTFAGKTIRPSKKYEISSEGCTYTLKINKCALSDINQVSIKCKTTKSSAQLSVKEMAIEFHKELESQDVMEGDVTFTCELTKPNQEATCTFPDETICLSKKYEVTLKINKCALSDINQVSIKCKTAKSSAQLFMKGKKAKRATTKNLTVQYKPTDNPTSIPEDV